MNYNFIENADEISVETEITRNFYRPAISSVKLYRERPKEAQDAIVKAMTRSAARAWKFWSLLVTITALSAVAQCHA